MQLTHYNSKFNKQKHPIVIVCDNINNAANIGGLFRIADAFSIDRLIFCGEDFQLGHRFKKASRATENIVNYDIKPNVLNLVKSLKDNNYKVIALEITHASTELSQVRFNSNMPIAIVVGDERLGVSKDILDLADVTTHINMYGQNSSMNVVQATSIILYEITKQLNA